jgi:ribonuclease P protein component
MLAKQNRLRKPREISRVYRQGIYGGCFGELSVKALATKRPDSRYVVVVGKKISKKAVVRNLIRRRVVNLIRDMWATLPVGYDIVISIHTDVSRYEMVRLKELIIKSLTRAKVME